MRQEAECARVDFPCPSLKQDLRKGKMMTMTIYPPQRGFCIVALAQPVLLLSPFPLYFGKLITSFIKFWISSFEIYPDLI